MGKTWAKDRGISFLLVRKHFSLLRDEKIKFGHVWRDEITKNSLPLHPRTVGKASVRPSLRRRRVERELAAAATCGLFFLLLLLLFQPPVVQGLHGKRRRVGPKYGGETRGMCAGLFLPPLPFPAKLALKENMEAFPDLCEGGRGGAEESEGRRPVAETAKGLVTKMRSDDWKRGGGRSRSRRRERKRRRRTLRRSTVVMAQSTRG